MTKHPSRKAMNFRHLRGCDTIVNSNVYPVCQSLKNKLRVGAGQIVIAEYVPNFFWDGRVLLFWWCDSWEYPVILDSGYSDCLCFSALRWAFFVRVSLWGSRGAAWLLNFVFGVTLAYV